jgi:ribosomal protein S27AE
MVVKFCGGRVLQIKIMKVLVKESQLRRIFEIVTKDKVICDECGWSWDLADGGDDPYICHKCGHDNFVEIKNDNSNT